MKTKYESSKLSKEDIENIENRVTTNLDSSIENLAELIRGYKNSQDDMNKQLKEFKSFQEEISKQISEIKDKHIDFKDPGVFSFGSTCPKPIEILEEKHRKGKSESNSRENSKDTYLKNTRKRSSSPAAKILNEKKPEAKKLENKNKKKNERKTKLEKLYQNFSAKNT